MTPEQLRTKQLALGEIPMDEAGSEGMGLDLSILNPAEQLALFKNQEKYKWTSPESQPKMAAAMAGGTNLPLPNASKYVGDKASKLAQWLGGKLSGLTTKEAQTLASNPKTIAALQKADPLRRQQFAEKAIGSTAKSIDDLISNENAKIASSLEGKTLPYTSDIRIAEDAAKSAGYSPQGLGADPVMNTVSAKEVDNMRKFIGNKKTKWSLDPTTGEFSKATDPAMGAAYGTAKAAEVKAIPEVGESLATQSKSFEALNPLNKAQNRPASFLEQRGTDVEAAKQLADEVANRTRLQRTAQQMQVAKKLESPSGSMLDRINREGGKALIKAGTKTGQLISKGATPEDLLKRTIISHTTATTPEMLKPSDENDWTDINDDEWIDIK